MLIGPLLILIFTPVTSLAAWALARAFGGARSRVARATLGSALDRVPEGGGVVTLRGRLDAEGALCKRFEDDGAAAAVTAVAQRTEGEPTTEASARGGGLTLQVGNVPVRLEGPLRVIAGSREATAGSAVASLGGRVLDRIGKVDPEVAWTLSRRAGQVRLRSLASGDRVRVAGRLRRADTAIEGGAKGYRDAGVPWCLVPDEGGESPSMRAAFEGAPGGPRVRRAAIAGGVLGVIAAVVIGVLTLPPLPPPPGEVHWGKYSVPPTNPSSSNERPRDARLDRVVAALDEGDFEQASAGMPPEHWEGLFTAELHALAGRFEEGAASLSSFSAPLLGAEIKPCVQHAYLARGPLPRAAESLKHLQVLATRADPEGNPWQRMVCSLLLADLLHPMDPRRLRLLDALPAGGRGPLSRLRALLAIESGRMPRDIPDDSTDLPRASALLHRAPFAYDSGLIAVHLTAALARSPGALGDAHFRAREAARAAHLLSAVGKDEAARRAWETAQREGAIGSIQLTTLRVAIELRSGAFAAASKLAAELPEEDDLSLVITQLAGGTIDPRRAGWGSEAKTFMDLIASGDVTQQVMSMNLTGASDDGQVLFLVVPRIHAGREALLDWVRKGNRERSWHGHKSKGQLTPHAPAYFLARLEERRQMAASLGDPAFAADLGEKLHRARARLLRREVAGLIHVLHNTRYAD